ncbi:DNA-repair protein Xrcc1, N-terminal,BRCT domain,Galactose-binding domain-like [Cinara cedri]|uniref:DNA-repair protein Xrcc1, N-terminal,BRCT domain,Galactose-binding domain-like n=1 Tax=Cinara cedri TaxID=506608 RepID=A0A5E4MMA9_9HEMI|nr:DNA-repair protein Xrcc1, N-terminal,BRCT domain,Galactose-binding domain-like [Cinara cedri]
MGPIKVDRIISISSEEQANKAEYILNSSDSHKTWRCKAGEKQATVILQFLETSVISSIDIGNDNSAFVEIFVGKSTSEEFQVLLVTSSLMTLHECKNGLNVNKVRFFDSDQLTLACKESWDRVKIVCTQPFIKQATFGLSFITFHSKDIPQREQKEPIQPPISNFVQLGSFTLRMDDEPDDLHSAGKLFNKRHENKEIVDKDSPIQRIIALNKKNLTRREDSVNDKALRKDNNDSPLTSRKVSKNDSVKLKKKDSIITPFQNKATGTKKKESPVTSNQHPNSAEPSRKKIKLSKNPLPVTKPFNELLNDVIFLMSGYENPNRSAIRSKALEMGAIYKNNWDQSCTHLICAFSNTPKYREAKSQGVYRIVKSDWIHKCHANRCRYPWRRFALDKIEQNKIESEDEIHEHVKSPQDNDDTDDIWDNIPSKQPVISTSQTNVLANQQCTVDLSVYDAATDIDSDSDNISNDILADERSAPLPLIENVFRECSFYLSPTLKPLITKECYRYIIALDGKLNTKEKCDYIVSIDTDDLKLQNTVTPQWIYDCYDEGKVLPLNNEQKNN